MTRPGATRRPITWDCPRCRRRVPLRIEVCHCGMRQATAAQLARQPSARGRGLPWQVWIWGGVMTLALILGIVWLIVAPRPDPIVPVLGHVDRGAPPPVPPSKGAAPRR